LTNVNDGVCDYEVCCDGSDEFEGVGGVKCPDKCKEIGKEWRKQDEIRQKSMGAALKKRVEMVTNSARVRREVEDRVKDLEVQVQGSQGKVQEMEAKLAEEERISRGRVVKGPGKTGKVGVLAGLAKSRINELQGALDQVQQERDNAAKRLAEVEQILTTFKEEYNPNFNDEGVKRAVRAWEDYAAREKDAPGAISDADLAEMLKPDGEGGVIDWQEWERPEESDLDLRKPFLPLQTSMLTQ
jgi:protein kinase C substrate 80K-H